jgi:hypothetical protein
MYQEDVSLSEQDITVAIQDLNGKHVTGLVEPGRFI